MKSLASFSLLVSLLLVLLLVNPASATATRLEVKATNALLGEICSKTIDSNFCLQALKSDPRTASADLGGLALISIDLTSASATGTYAMISTLIKQATNPQLKQRYALCSKDYASAISELNATQQFLKTGDFKSLNDQASSALDQVENCGDEFKVPPPDPSQLREKNQNFEKLCDIILVISQHLPALY